MTKFVEIEQDGKIATVNTSHLVLILPSTLIGQADLVLANGLKVTVRGSVQEVTAKMEGKFLLDLT